ncbi:MAG: type VI secretion system tip protein VgrG, partial [Gammaproteobacteria bacterium]|nr:type VI secretion system tip protein VgrG [Gammaproteobacteria bacterium]
YAKVRMEELAYAHEVCTGQSDSRGLCSGYKFKMSKHTRTDQNREYLNLSTDYQAAAQDYETSGGQDEMCACFFTVVPSSVQYRPRRKTPKPVIQGTQTAVVTGPSGEEIYPDEYGRIKVQFHWDRQGKLDENSSCWIRVSQVHAGKSFGGIDIPRIGEEVIVSFMEGDPDQPLITGRVYNAELMPPFGLPDQKVVSGMKSNSSPGGGGYNEISLNDTKSKEGMTIHAQYNMDTTVENDQSNIVHNNRTTTVDVDDTESVGSNQNISIGADQTIDVGSNQKASIGSNRTLNIGVNDTIDIGAKRTESIGANHELTVGGSQKIGVSGAIMISSDTSITLTVGGSTVKIEPDAVSIK